MRQADMPVLDDLKRIRASRRNAALREYRRIVGLIAEGEGDPADFGREIDDIMMLLELSDDTLATDCGLMRQHRECSARLAEFAPKRADVQKRRDKAKAEVAKLEKEYKSFDLRYATAQAEVQDVGAPLQSAWHDARRVEKLERDNPRLFEVIDDG